MKLASCDLWKHIYTPHVSESSRRFWYGVAVHRHWRFPGTLWPNMPTMAIINQCIAALTLCAISMCPYLLLNFIKIYYQNFMVFYFKKNRSQYEAMTWNQKNLIIHSSSVLWSSSHATWEMYGCAEWSAKKNKKNQKLLRRRRGELPTEILIAIILISLSES